MSGQTSVRSAEDLESGALTYAEIKAIASGNPAVMEKVKVDTEIRKLDQLRAAHLNQQHSIRWQIRALPHQIAETAQTLASVQADIETRDAHGDEDFSMTVGNRVFSGKGAREDAANALTLAVLSWRDDLTLQPRATFRGFQIMSRGRRGDGEPQIPDLFVKGSGLYGAHLNPETPVGTVQSIEHTLRALDKFAAQEEEHKERLDKTLSDYRAQANLPFQQESRLKDLLAQQAQLNAALDLDKGERQAAEPAASEPDSPDQLPAARLPVTMPARYAVPAPAT